MSPLCKTSRSHNDMTNESQIVASEAFMQNTSAISWYHQLVYIIIFSKQILIGQFLILDISHDKMMVAYGELSMIKSGVITEDTYHTSYLFASHNSDISAWQIWFSHQGWNGWVWILHLLICQNNSKPININTNMLTVMFYNLFFISLCHLWLTPHMTH